MDNALAWNRPFTFAEFRALAWPREHGSWSLALEPVALGLLVAPSAAGGWLALAIVAGFFARRPLRSAWREARADRRADAVRALAVCAAISILGLTVAFSLAGPAWLIWLSPAAVAGAVFVSFDLRSAGREEAAEVAGAAAFASLPCAIAVLGGASTGTAIALGVTMCGRAVPTVLSVRAALRAMKDGTARRAAALSASVIAFGAVLALGLAGHAPLAAVIALAVLALRSVALLVFPRPALRARTIGMIEAALGIAFVIAVATAWRL